MCPFCLWIPLIICVGLKYHDVTLAALCLFSVNVQNIVVSNFVVLSFMYSSLLCVGQVAEQATGQTLAFYCGSEMHLLFACFLVGNQYSYQYIN